MEKFFLYVQIINFIFNVFLFFYFCSTKKHLIERLKSVSDYCYKSKEKYTEWFNRKDTEINKRFMDIFEKSVKKITRLYEENKNSIHKIKIMLKDIEDNKEINEQIEEKNNTTDEEQKMQNKIREEFESMMNYSFEDSYKEGDK